MKHIIYMDPLEKLNLKKDSSLLLALSLQSKGFETYLLFKNDLFWSQPEVSLTCYKFSGKIRSDFYLEEVKLGESLKLKFNANDIVHMRLDPPFDGQYLRSLWLLENYHLQGVRIVNSARGIMNNHEKLKAYSLKDSIPSFVGESAEGFNEFIKALPISIDELVMKPLDLFSGIGVEKVDRNTTDLVSYFKNKCIAQGGAIVVQPFMKSVYQGEIRAIYFKGEFLGAILKKPALGEFISNIAQGAKFEKTSLTHDVSLKAQGLAKELSLEGVDWIAYDILGDAITEINVTCPGLLVEASFAQGENLAFKIIECL